MRKSILSNNPKPTERYDLVYRLITDKDNKKSKIWNFSGYRCNVCDKILKNDSTLPKHSTHCMPRERKYNIDEPEQIIDRYGRPWEKKF
jgi:hypothetical protein